MTIEMTAAKIGRRMKRYLIVGRVAHGRRPALGRWAGSAAARTAAR